jgi:hypothetical protein
MKRSTRKKVVRAIEKRLTEILRATSATDDLSDVKEAKTREIWRSGSFEIGLSDSLRSELESALNKRPEPADRDLDNFLKELRSIDADEVLRPSLKHLARKLPPFPPGKPPVLNPAQRKKVLAEVARLSSHRNISRKEVYRRVATKYSVHWRTIQNLSIETYKRGRKEA